MVSKNSKIIYPIFRYSSLVLFLAISAISAESVEIKRTYSKPEGEIKAFNIYSNLMLDCVPNPASTDTTIRWYKDNTLLHGSDRIKIRDAEYKLIVEKTKETDAGTYRCDVTTPAGNGTATYKVIANVIAHLPKNTAASEEETLTITCVAKGTDPQFQWVIGNKTYNGTNNDERVTLSADEAGHPNAVISIANIVLEDRGNVTCEVWNEASFENTKAVTFVRVKGKLAALWPFIGICAEVIVLCAIILIYEKRRNKQEAEESDTDSPELKK